MRIVRVLPMVAGVAAAVAAVVFVATPASAESVFSFSERSSYSDSVSINHYNRRSDLGATRQAAARQDVMRDDDDEDAAPRRRSSRSEQQTRQRARADRGQRSKRAESRQQKRVGRIARSADDQQYEAPRSRRRGARTASLGGASDVGSHGVASFYWQPQRVASGGWFNPNAMTAAHKTLPFGTRVRVTHARTGRSVVVRINDRGPYIRGRTIDLSRAAAGVIGMLGEGVTRIRMEILGR